MLALVIVFGIIAAGLSYRYVVSVSKAALVQKGMLLGTLLDEQIAEMLLVDDLVSINSTIDHVKANDHDILYLVVFDKTGGIAGHTFETNSIPTYLAHAPFGTRTDLFRDKRHQAQIRQMTFPIMKGTLGVLVLGLDDRVADVRGKKIAGSMLLVFGLILLPTLVAQVLFSSLINRPVQQILKGFREFTPGKALPSLSIKGNDEFKQLAAGFISMMERIVQVSEESKQMQLKMIDTEKLASVGLLASGIAHEINNPITGIEMCAYRLQKQNELSEKNEKYVTLIFKGINHIKSVVQNLLGYARNPDLNFSDVDLRLILDSAIKLTAYRIERNKIDLRFSPPDQPCMVRGIQVQLVQVIVNGIINAIDSIGKTGTIRLKIDPAGSAFVVTIEDTGTGLSPEAQRKVFQPFFTTKGNRGTGLGLYVSYTIMQAHGGTIRLNPRVEGGACLTLQFPPQEALCIS